MANTTKMTKKARFAQLLALEEVVAIEGMREFLEKEVSALERKSATSANKSAEKKSADLVFENMIENAMEVGKEYRVSDIQTIVPELMPPAFSTSKVTSLMRDMMERGVVDNKTEKGKSLYFLVEG